MYQQERNKMKITDLLNEGNRIDPRAMKQPKDLTKTKNPKVIAFRDSMLAQYPNVEFYDPRIAIPKDGSWHIAAVVNGEIVDELTGNAFRDLKRDPVIQKKINPSTEENLEELRFDPKTGKPIRDKASDITPFVKSFKKLDGGAEPVSDMDWAVKLTIDGVSDIGAGGHNLRKYGVPTDRVREIGTLLQSVPSIGELEQAARNADVTATQQQQSDQLGTLQHNLNVQQLIRQNRLDDADTEAMLQMDVEARQAIKERMQAMELESKERLAKVEIDIRNSKQDDNQREFELEKARAEHSHEVEVIKITAEGEYKKAKLEADYQIKIKELENIDNMGERQNRLDVINTEKQKEIEVINANTSARIKVIQAQTDANRAESDTRIREEFMGEFRPIWGSLIQKASQVGKTVGQNIGAVMGALGKLGKVVMPKAESKESISYYKNLIDEIQGRK